MKSRTLKSGEILDFDEGEHCYSIRDEPAHPLGVTTGLKLLAKEALIQWAANCAAEHISHGYISRLEAGEMPETTSFLALCEEAKTAHRRVSKQAADIGTLIHKFAQKVLVDGSADIPSDPKVASGANAFLEWYGSHKVEPQVWNGEKCVEFMLFSPTWYYAGTTDFFGYIDGELCVLDFKSSNPFSTWRGRSGPYTEMHLQLAAYAMAIEEEMDVKINTGWIVRLDKQTGAPDPYRIELGYLVKSAWTYLVDLHRSLSKLEERLKDGIRKSAA